MNISISPITNNIPKFRATQKDETNAIAKENKKPLTHQQLATKRTKIALGCCLAAALAVDVIYFAMKRNIKYEKIKRQDLKIQKLNEKFAVRPKTIFELFAENKEKYGEDAAKRFKEIVTNKRID